MSQKTNGTVKYAVTGIVFAAMIGVLLGLLLLFAPVALLLNIMFVLLGILTVFNNLPTLIFSLFELKTTAGKVLFLLSLVATFLGVMMIFFHNSIYMILLGVYFVLVPVLRLIFSKERAELVREELPKVILGVVMILLGPAYIVSILFHVAGWVVLIMTAVYVVSALIALRRAQHKTGARVFVDVDGDGTIDALYVDTTGDGKVDTATRYRDEQ